MATIKEIQDAGARDASNVFGLAFDCDRLCLVHVDTRIFKHPEFNGSRRMYWEAFNREFLALADRYPDSPKFRRLNRDLSAVGMSA